MAFVSVGGFGLQKAQASKVSSFAGTPVAARVVRSKVTVPRMGVEFSEGESFDANPLVVGLGIAGWMIPSSIPAGIPLFKGTGLTQAFIASISDNLARYPKGPAGDDPFWTLLFMWHFGLFACLIFGSIGYNGNKAGTFK